MDLFSLIVAFIAVMWLYGIYDGQKERQGERR